MYDMSIEDFEKLEYINSVMGYDGEISEVIRRDKKGDLYLYDINNEQVCLVLDYDVILELNDRVK